MPEETKTMTEKTDSKPEVKAKAAPKPKPAPAPVAVESDDVPRGPDGRPRVRVTRNIRANGGRGGVVYGHKGLYFDGDAKKLWTEFRDCCEPYTEKE